MKRDRERVFSLTDKTWKYADDVRPKPPRDLATWPRTVAVWAMTVAGIYVFWTIGQAIAGTDWGSSPQPSSAASGSTSPEWLYPPTIQVDVIIQIPTATVTPMATASPTDTPEPTPYPACEDHPPGACAPATLVPTPAPAGAPNPTPTRVALPYWYPGISTQVDCSERWMSDRYEWSEPPEWCGVYYAVPTAAPPPTLEPT